MALRSTTTVLYYTTKYTNCQKVKTQYIVEVTL